MRIGSALLLAFLWASAGTGVAGAQTAAQKRASETPAASAPAMSVTTRVDKTAVWVGDQLHYQITVDHAPDVQFVLENLNKDTIQLDPFRVVEVHPSTVDLKNGRKRLFVDVTLASFSTGVGAVQIPQVTLFYFRRDSPGGSAASGGGAAAESLTVPGPLIGVRSTLPPDPSELRDAVTVNRWPRSRRLVAVLGWCAALVLVAGAGWEAARVIRHGRDRKGPDPRKAMNAIRKRWSESVPADFGNAATVREFYDRSYRDLKEYLAYLLDTPTDGLTADELRAEIARKPVRPEIAERLAAVLTACETVPYLRSGSEPAGEVARTVAREIEEIFEAS